MVGRLSLSKARHTKKSKGPLGHPRRLHLGDNLIHGEAELRVAARGRLLVRVLAPHGHDHRHKVRVGHARLQECVGRGRGVAGGEMSVFERARRASACAQSAAGREGSAPPPPHTHTPRTTLATPAASKPSMGQLGMRSSAAAASAKPRAM